MASSRAVYRIHLLTKLMFARLIKCFSWFWTSIHMAMWWLASVAAGAEAEIDYREEVNTVKAASAAGKRGRRTRKRLGKERKGWGTGDRQQVNNVDIRLCAVGRQAITALSMENSIVQHWFIGILLSYRLRCPDVGIVEARRQRHQVNAKIVTLNLFVVAIEY